jgi:hypothetical protein
MMGKGPIYDWIIILYCFIFGKYRARCISSKGIFVDAGGEESEFMNVILEHTLQEARYKVSC